ncbi:hypothetical protein [Algoriphagus faecimaris]|uniref:hypothetical protein n=1 Tax=Algoriphagus faecimaris TaxID=686796 RepID=UPI00146E1386|nr:hypothetical protein [Algoriphagus faecimaris]
MKKGSLLVVTGDPSRADGLLITVMWLIRKIIEWTGIEICGFWSFWAKPKGQEKEQVI